MPLKSLTGLYRNTPAFANANTMGATPHTQITLLTILNAFFFGAVQTLGFNSLLIVHKNTSSVSDSMIRARRVMSPDRTLAMAASTPALGKKSNHL